MVRFLSKSSKSYHVIKLIDGGFKILNQQIYSGNNHYRQHYAQHQIFIPFQGMISIFSSVSQKQRNSKGKNNCSYKRKVKPITDPNLEKEMLHNSK